MVGVPPHADSLHTSEEAVSKLSHNQDPVVVEWNPPGTIIRVLSPVTYASLQFSNIGISVQRSDALATSADLAGRTRQEQDHWLRMRGLVAKIINRHIALSAALTPQSETPEPAPASQGKGGKGKATADKSNKTTPVNTSAIVDKSAVMAATVCLTDALRRLTMTEWRLSSDGGNAAIRTAVIGCTRFGRSVVA